MKKYYIYDSCPVCGIKRTIKSYRKGMLCRSCSQRKCTNKGRFKKQAQHPRWNGGVYIRHGYIFILSPKHPNANNHGYIRKHRLVMEKLLGRRLKNEEVVHHIDGNKKNNNPNNLMLFPNNSIHIKHHRSLCGNIKSKLV